LLTLLLPNVLAGGMASYYAGMKLVANNRNKEYVMAVAAGALVNLVLNLLLVPLWGAVAAALLTCLSQFTVAGVAAWFGRDIVSPSVLQCAAKPFLVSLFMGAVLVLTRMFIPETHVLLLVALGAALYAGGWYASTRLAVLFHPRVMV
jgi:O-antigen/teichoic acid export membrane protein